jgi:hypothetical protein
MDLSHSAASARIAGIRIHDGKDWSLALSTHGERDPRQI